MEEIDGNIENGEYTPVQTERQRSAAEMEALHRAMMASFPYNQLPFHTTSGIVNFNLSVGRAWYCSQRCFTPRRQS